MVVKRNPRPARNAAALNAIVTTIVALNPDMYASSTPTTYLPENVLLISLAPVSRTKAELSPAAVTARRLSNIFWKAAWATEIPNAPPSVCMTVYGVKHMSWIAKIKQRIWTYKEGWRSLMAHRPLST